MSNPAYQVSKVGETTELNEIPGFGFGYGEFIELVTELLSVSPGLFRKAERTKVRDNDAWIKNRLVLEWYDEPPSKHG